MVDGGIAAAQCVATYINATLWHHVRAHTAVMQPQKWEYG